MKLEQKILTLIANAGESRSDSLEAIECAKLSQFNEADELLEKASKELTIAHRVHTEILAESVQKNSEITVTFILVHASNHLSIAEVMIDMAKNFIQVIKEMKRND